MSHSYFWAWLTSWNGPWKRARSSFLRFSMRTEAASSPWYVYTLLNIEFECPAVVDVGTFLGCVFFAWCDLIKNNNYGLKGRSWKEQGHQVKQWEVKSEVVATKGSKTSWIVVLLCSCFPWFSSCGENYFKHLNVINAEAHAASCRMANAIVAVASYWLSLQAQLGSWFEWWAACSGNGLTGSPVSHDMFVLFPSAIIQATCCWYKRKLPCKA